MTRDREAPEKKVRKILYTTCVLGLPKEDAGPLTQFLDLRATGRVVKPAHRRRQADILCRAPGLEARYRALATPEAASLSELGN